MTADSIAITRTARDTGEKLSERAPVHFGPDTYFDAPSLLVDPQQRCQTIEGFGGAFTEASAVTFYKMDTSAQAAILKAYFDPHEGNGYTLCRTHINSCDFSLGNYAYDETPGDVALEHFSIEHDRHALIPFIKAAKQVAGGRLALFASPWSPPAWMKTNGKMNNGGALKPEYRAAWAHYYTRYAQAYAAEDLPIWGFTVQNEPEATQTWDSCIYTGAEERDFVRDYLGPTLKAAGLAHLRLMIWDHNRDRMYERAKAVLDDPAAAQYVWGVAFHWYMSDSFENVQRVHDAFPDKALVFTEGCQEAGPHAGDWQVGERYARSMIADLNHWTCAWVDWNLLLDEIGGPNHVGNYCSAPIIADTRLGSLDGVLFNPSYYYMGHITRFARPGVQRIISAPTIDALEAVAFRAQDGDITAVVMNRTDQAIAYALKCSGGCADHMRAAMVDAPAHSITTFRFKEAGPV